MKLLKNYFILFTLPIIFLTGCAQKVVQAAPEKPDVFKAITIKEPLISINIIDRNGLSETITSKERVSLYQNSDFVSSQPYQKVMRAFAKDKEGTSHSIITSYHENGQIRQYLEIVNGRAHGTYCEWHANGKKKLLARLIAGVADIDEKSQGTWAFDKISFAWDEEGRLMTQIPYDKGEIEGLALYYHANGKLAKEVPYSKGEIEGEVRTFAPDSSLIESTFFKAGLLHGNSIGFWPNQALSWNEHFENGLLEDGTYYGPQGNLISSVNKGNGKRCLFDEKGPSEFYEYKDGKPEGEVTLVEDSGSLICRYFLKNGEKHGEEVRYYPPKPFSSFAEQKPIPKLSIQWYEGKIHGIVKTWYEDGTPESQKEMSQNLKQGHLTAWYQNGNLMLIEEYEKNRLVRGEYIKKSETIATSKVENGKGIATLYDGDGNFNRKVHYQDGKPLEE